MDRRKEAIVNAVDQFLDAYEEWQADDSDYKIQPDSNLADHLEILEGVIGNGHVPQQCFNLVHECRKLMVAYRRYQEGEWKAGSLEPTERFYLGVRAVQAARVEASPPEAQLMEPVRQLRAEGVTDRQIAHMYGTRDPRTGTWSGPFLKNNVPQSRLIDQEAQNPGSVIPEDWIHPNQVARQERFEQEMKDRLHRIDNRANEAAAQRQRQTVRPSEAEIVAYLEEGAFPTQAYKRWRDSGVTMADIADIIARNDIVPSSDDDPTAPADRLSPEDAALMEPPARADDTDPPETEFSQEAFAERVLELHNAGQATADIRTAVQHEFGQTFSPQKVAAVIRGANAEAETAGA